MLAIELEKNAVKGFMGKLLREDVLDSFEARSVEILQRNRVTIDGMIENSIDSESEDIQTKRNFSTWGELRPMVYDIIRSGNKPSLVKIVFSHGNPSGTHPNAAALFLNMVYENDEVTFTTAASQKEFALSKAVDDIWDDSVRQFFLKAGIIVKDRI